MLGAEFATDTKNNIPYNVSEGECVEWKYAIKICMLLKDISY